ncbi:MAG: TonB-dependent receptor [Pseudomonadota bacterium]
MAFSKTATCAAVAISLCGSFFPISQAWAAAAVDRVETITVEGQYVPLQLTQSIDEITTADADFGNMLAQFPGLQINRNGTVTGVMQYRGLTGDRFVVDFSGAPIAGAGPNAMDSPLSHVLPMPNTKIILHQGIAPVTAGSEKLTGHLAVEHPAIYSSEPGFLSNLSAQYHSTDSAEHVKFNTQYRTDNTYLAFAAQNQEADNGETGSSIERTNSFYDRHGVGFQAVHKIDDHEIDVSIKHMHTGNAGTPALNMDIDFIDADWYRLAYTNQSILDGELKISLSSNHNDHVMDNFQSRPIASTAAARMNTVDSESYGAGVQWQDDAIAVGIHWQQQANNSVITNPNNPMFRVVNFNDVERDVVSAYAQYQRESARQRFTIGVQPTRVSVDGDEVSHHMAMMNPNVGSLVSVFNNADRSRDFSWLDVVANYQLQLNASWLVNIDAGIKHRAPSYTEMFVWFPLGISAGLADGNNYLGNLDLSEEQAKQLNLAFSFLDDDWQLQTQVFYSDIDDYIIGEPSQNMTANMISMMMGSRPLLQWQNADVKLYGWEVQLTKQIVQDIDFYLQAVDVFATNKTQNEALYRIAPRHLTTALTYSRQKWELVLQSEIFAAQDDVSMLNNETASSGYGLVHIKGNYQFDNGLGLGFAINNLFDRAYQPHLAGVNRVSGAEEAVGERLYAPGMDVQLAVTYDF